MIKQNFRSILLRIAFPLLGAVIAVSLANAFGDDPDKIPEIGEVHWSADLESAKQKSEKTGRPVFLLFQEIPG